MEKFVLTRHYAHQRHERERIVRVPVCVGDLVEPLNWVSRKLTGRSLQTTHRIAPVSQWFMMDDSDNDVTGLVPA